MKLNSNLTERESKHNMVETDNSAVQTMQVIPAYNSDIHILCEDKQQLRRTVLARVSELKDLVNRTETVDALNVMLQNVHVSNHTVGKELEAVGAPKEEMFKLHIHFHPAEVWNAKKYFLYKY